MNAVLRKRFPASSEIFAVYSVIVFFWFTWGLIVFFFNFPSLILTASFDDVLSYFAYGMVFIFIDTLLTLVIILGVTALMPAPWFKNDFIVGGSILAALFFFWVLAIGFTFGYLAYWPAWNLMLMFSTVLASIVLFEYIFRRLSVFRRAVLWFSSSAGIFVYIYGFFSAAGLLVVFFRNIF